MSTASTRCAVGGDLGVVEEVIEDGPGSRDIALELYQFFQVPFPRSGRFQQGGGIPPVENALVKLNGRLAKVVFFVMAFERECAETFWEGHVRAFEFFGGVPKRITCDGDDGVSGSGNLDQGEQ